MIAASVFYFSLFYISAEKFKSRFHICLLAFVFSIFVLIRGADFLTLLIGWDGLGVTSYLLVVYFNRVKSNNAGIITVLTNRVGDVAIIIFIAKLLESNC